MVEYLRHRDIKSLGIIERLEYIRQLRSRMQQSWEEAIKRQARYYNARHTPRKYTNGQVIGLSTRNFRFKGGLKLVPCFIPIKIEKRIGNQAYRVTLPIKYALKHNVFPIELLEPWTGLNDLKHIPLPDLEDEREVWEVEDIETHHNTTRGRRYFVKWKG